MIDAPLRFCVECGGYPRRRWNEYYLCSKCCKKKLKESAESRGLKPPQEPPPKQGDIPY